MNAFVTILCITVIILIAASATFMYLYLGDKNQVNVQYATGPVNPGAQCYAVTTSAAQVRDVSKYVQLAYQNGILIKTTSPVKNYITFVRPTLIGLIVPIYGSDPLEYVLIDWLDGYGPVVTNNELVLRIEQKSVWKAYMTNLVSQQRGVVFITPYVTYGGYTSEYMNKLQKIRPLPEFSTVIIKT
jgi:hypothetical protein